MNQVILVDENDNQLGVSDKMEAHQKGLLHRAISVFIFSSSGKLLLQQRAKDKYHSGGLWTNTCCSHPKPGEQTQAAASRRLKEEMGLESGISYAFTFNYKVEFENGLIENEVDHIFVGRDDMTPNPDAKEAMAWKYTEMEKVLKDIVGNPENYTYWFRLLLPKVVDHISRNPI